MKWLLILLMAVLSYGQEKGYKDLPWGSPSSLMKTKYPNFKDTVIDSDPAYSNYIVRPIDGPICLREFDFFKDRLCVVHASYSDRNNPIFSSQAFTGTIAAILSDLNKRFGNARTLSIDTISFLKPKDALLVIDLWRTKSVNIEGRVLCNKISGVVYYAIFTYSSKKFLNEFEKQMEQQKPEY